MSNTASIFGNCMLLLARDYPETTGLIHYKNKYWGISEVNTDVERTTLTLFPFTEKNGEEIKLEIFKSKFIRDSLFVDENGFPFEIKVGKQISEKNDFAVYRLKFRQKTNSFWVDALFPISAGILAVLTYFLPQFFYTFLFPTIILWALLFNQKRKNTEWFELIP